MTTWSAEVVMAQSKYSESISESICSSVSQPESSSSVVPRSDDSDAEHAFRFCQILLPIVKNVL